MRPAWWAASRDNLAIGKEDEDGTKLYHTDGPVSYTQLDVYKRQVIAVVAVVVVVVPSALQLGFLRLESRRIVSLLEVATNNIGIVVKNCKDVRNTNQLRGIGIARTIDGESSLSQGVSRIAKIGSCLLYTSDRRFQTGRSRFGSPL